MPKKRMKRSQKGPALTVMQPDAAGIDGCRGDVRSGARGSRSAAAVQGFSWKMAGQGNSPACWYGSWTALAGPWWTAGTT